MPTENTPQTVLEHWRTILGDKPELGDEYAGRDLWPVKAEDSAMYFLKRLGPWRNLPLADEARILRFLANQGIPVAEFVISDHAALYAVEIEDSFVLIPRLQNDAFNAGEHVYISEEIGVALAQLHLALAGYPWSANSYLEDLRKSTRQELMLPSDLAELFDGQRDSIMSALANLPLQLVHGDMTPENVLLKRPAAVSGFIDFDHLPMAPRVWDIGKYLSRCIRLRWRQGSSASEVGRLTHLPGLLRGYHQTSPLSAVEIEALPALIALGNVLEVSYMQEISAGILERRKLPDHDEELADTIEAARWHLAHVDQVAETVRSIID